MGGCARWLVLRRGHGRDTFGYTVLNLHKRAALFIEILELRGGGGGGPLREQFHKRN
jgi:hypothetical protein